MPENEWVNIAINPPGDNYRCARTYIEGIVQRTIRVQAGYKVTRLALDSRKVAANDDFSIALDGHVPNPIARLRKEAFINTAISIQPGYVRSVPPVKAGKITANQNAAVLKWKNLFNNSPPAPDPGLKDVSSRPACVATPMSNPRVSVVSFFKIPPPMGKTYH